MGTKYKQSIIGTARHAWVNKPDTKFVNDGLFHVELVAEGDEAEAFKAEIDEAVDAAYDAQVADAGMKPAEAKKWGKYYPYEVETDDDNGNPTGRIIFKFKQNHKIRLKDGGVKTFFVGIRDRKNKETTENVFGGDTIRVLYSTRNTKLATAKQFGVRLDFAMVQLIKKAPNQSGGFDEVDGDYADDVPPSGSDATDSDEY